MYKAKIEVLILRPLLSTEKQSLMDCTQENDRFFQGHGVPDSHVTKLYSAPYMYPCYKQARADHADKAPKSRRCC